MSKIISKLLGGRQSSSDLASAIAKAQDELEAAEAAVVAAEEQYQSSLLTEGATSLRKLADAKADAGITVDICVARVAKLTQQHEAALESEAADRRQSAYNDAKAAAEAARKKLTAEYPKLGQALRSLLKEIAESDILVDAANAELPDGAERLAKAEDFRSQPTLYREERGQAVVDVWVACGDRSSPLPDHLQRQVHPEQGPRRDGVHYGRVQTESGGWLEVERRRFTRVQFMPHQDGRSIGSLSSELNLPPLHAGATAFWSASNFAPYRIVAEIDKPLLPPPARAERQVECEYRNPPKEPVNVE